MEKVDKAIEDIGEWISENLKKESLEESERVIEMTNALANLINSRALIKAT